jgi:transcriptional antiterminator RfaH
MIFPNAEDPLWYCVRTQPRQEQVAAGHICRLEDVETFCPRIKLQKAQRDGAAPFVVEALFPGYLFARFAFAQRHRDIRYAHGVSHIIQFGLRYPTVPDSWITELRSEFSAGPVKEVTAPLAIGTAVQVIGGPFRGLTAVVTQRRSGAERVRVLLEFLGRDIEAELPTSLVLAETLHPLARHA